jgi:tetraacyldisaccharide-1-P 4'-kinase
MFGDVALPESTRWYGDPPIRFTRFVGRSEPLFAVDSLLRPAQAASGGERVPVAVVLNGLGGVGKTALASEYATRFAATYPGGVFWLRLGSPAGGAELA